MTPARLAAALAGLALLAACTTEHPAPPAAPSTGGTPQLALAPVDYAALPGWGDDKQGEAIAALARSCARLVELPSSEPIGHNGVGGTAADWLGPCGALRALDTGDNAAVRAYFETWFAPFRATSTDGQQDGLFTGYYEAELKGSLTRQGPYQVPLLARPDDLMTIDLGPFETDLAGRRIWGRLDGNRFVPYWTRDEIDKGALGTHAHPLLWLADPVDAHILSIQGSGRIELPDGGQMRVGFDGTNGRTFVGLTRILLDAGKLAPDQATMPETRGWLEAHPADAPALMAKNPRYVFFRMIAGDGPIGAAGVALTPLRSLAVDARFVPFGVPVWLATATPDGAPLRRLMVAQDAGVAIKGPVRGDIFWGTGAAAFAQAGRMKSRGTLFLLIPRRRSTPVADASDREHLARLADRAPPSQAGAGD
jgi:membrane-bound lytic murein transglycosylase A